MTCNDESCAKQHVCFASFRYAFSTGTLAALDFMSAVKPCYPRIMQPSRPSDWRQAHAPGPGCFFSEGPR